MHSIMCNMCQQRAEIVWRCACKVQVQSPDLVFDKRVSAPAPTSHPNASPIHRVPRSRICLNVGNNPKLLLLPILLVPFTQSSNFI